jgi:hypothetical protein
VLRLIVVHNGRHPVYLVTSVLNAGELSAAQAAQIYSRRWGIEVYQPEYPSSAHLYQVAA